MSGKMWVRDPTGPEVIHWILEYAGVRLWDVPMHGWMEGAAREYTATAKLWEELQRCLEGRCMGLVGRPLHGSARPHAGSTRSLESTTHQGTPSPSPRSGC